MRYAAAKDVVRKLEVHGQWLVMNLLSVLGFRLLAPRKRFVTLRAS